MSSPVRLPAGRPPEPQWTAEEQSQRESVTREIRQMLADGAARYDSMTRLERAEALLRGIEWEIKGHGWMYDNRSVEELLQAIERFNAEASDAASRATQARALDWQSIETAPKDGTTILFALHDYGMASVDFGWYNGQVWRNYEGDLLFPTHWMPLPDPPASSRASEDETP